MSYITPIMGALLAVAITACAPNQANTKPPAHLSSDDQAKFAELMQRAQAGDPKAQTELANSWIGCETPSSSKQTVYWASQASKQGYSEGTSLLANLYWEGKCGLKQNYKKSFELVHLMAEQGDAKAQADLGEVYEEGINRDGVVIKPNLKKAKNICAWLVMVATKLAVSA